MRPPWLFPSILLMALTACGSEIPPNNDQITSTEAEPEEFESEPNDLATSDPAGEPGTVASAPKAKVDAVRSNSGYRLIGTEPFWGGTVSSNEIVYSTPENQAGEKVAVTTRFEGEREIYSGRLANQSFVLTLTDGPCSDGMSDNVHAFSARLEVGGEVRQGCANPNS